MAAMQRGKALLINIRFLQRHPAFKLIEERNKKKKKANDVAQLLLKARTSLLYVTKHILYQSFALSVTHCRPVLRCMPYKQYVIEHVSVPERKPGV